MNLLIEHILLFLLEGVHGLCVQAVPKELLEHPEAPFEDLSMLSQQATGSGWRGGLQLREQQVRLQQEVHHQH